MAASAKWSGGNSSTSFNATTGAQTNPNFGQISGARPGRIIELSLRVVF
jgi:hypothetical protein